jgi:sec-independent protein translocase protein TatA
MRGNRIRAIAEAAETCGRFRSYTQRMLSEIIGPDILIVLVVILVLFGGSQLPKLARGLGSAQREFKKGLEEGHADEDDSKKSEKSKSD